MTISLDNAISGLRAAQSSLNVISNNISNASVEGYTRKILPQETLLIGGEGRGVRLQAILRKVDMTLLRDFNKQTSVTAGTATRTQYLSRVQEFHGASEAERNLSAQIGRMYDAFSELSTAPDNSFQLNNAVNAAQQTAQTFNDFHGLLEQMRNEVQDDIASAITELNQSLESVADLNKRIAILDSQGKSTAEFEDQRDREIQNISQYLEISSYTIENKKIVLMTRRGETLVDNSAQTMSFSPTPATAGAYYPGGSLNGILIEGIDVTATNLGGKLGALITLRDQTIPTYQAQADEVAQKMAERFDAVGLRLFTDANRLVPASSTAPAPIGYVGFAGEIRVNPDIVADSTLLRTGSYGQVALPGSNEMVRKVLDNALGLYLGQGANGTTNISAGTVFASTGLTQRADLIGTYDITDYVPDLSTAPNLTLPGAFTVDIGGTAFAININPGDTATDLVNNINAAVGSTVASLNGLGQLRITANADITISDISLGGALALADLGLVAGTTTAQSPSFSVQVGTQSPITVVINPADTATDLLADLNAIPGLTATLNGSGQLVLTPTRGGSIALANVEGEPMQALGLNVVNIAHNPFRNASVGPDGSLNTGLLNNSTVADYTRSVLATQAEDAASAVTADDRESAYLQSLTKRNQDTSGVNLDQELSELIRVQTAYSAAARMISASEDMLDELFAAFR